MVINVRVKTAWNPINPDTENTAQVPVQILTNTLEQARLEHFDFRS